MFDLNSLWICLAPLHFSTKSNLIFIICAFLQPKVDFFCELTKHLQLILSHPSIACSLIFIKFKCRTERQEPKSSYIH